MTRWVPRHHPEVLDIRRRADRPRIKRLLDREVARIVARYRPTGDRPAGDEHPDALDP